jgi:hypothetical protein
LGAVAQVELGQQARNVRAYRGLGDYLVFGDAYDELVARDKANLDITWLRDESLEDADNLPAPEVIAREIVEDLTAALVEFEAVAAALEASSADS